MNINDSLILHLIKHLVWKSEEISTGNSIKRNGQLNSKLSIDEVGSNKQDTTEFKSYFLKQLEVVQETVTHLKTEFQSFQTSQSEDSSIKRSTNGQIKVAEPNISLLPNEFRNYLLLPINELQAVLPKSFFVKNEMANCSFGVENKGKLIYLYVFKTKGEASNQYNTLLHFIINKIILATQTPDIFDVFKEFDRKILEFKNQFSNPVVAMDTNFMLCVIDKMKAQIELVSSGIDLICMNDEELKEVKANTITFGNYETHQVEKQTLGIKRGSNYLMMPQSFVKRTNKGDLHKDFSKQINGLKTKDKPDDKQNLCTEWLNSQAGDDFILGFGF